MENAIRRLIYCQMQYYARRLGAQYRIFPGVMDVYKRPRFDNEAYLNHSAIRLGSTVGQIFASIEKINQLQDDLNALNARNRRKK